MHFPSTESDVSPTRRPTGTRRRQLEWLTNFVLVVVSLFGCSVGAGLLGFYKLHLLQFISFEFVLVPVVLLGAFTFRDHPYKTSAKFWDFLPPSPTLSAFGTDLQY